MFLKRALFLLTIAMMSKCGHSVLWDVPVFHSEVVPANVYQVPVQTIPPPPTSPPVDLLQVVDSWKQKIVNENPIAKLYRYVKSKPIVVPQPAYKLVPTLGFTKYHKIKYIPIVPKVPEPVYGPPSPTYGPPAPYPPPSGPYPPPVGPYPPSV